MTRRANIIAVPVVRRLGVPPRLLLRVLGHELPGLPPLAEVPPAQGPGEGAFQRRWTLHGLVPVLPVLGLLRSIPNGTVLLRLVAPAQLPPAVPADGHALDPAAEPAVAGRHRLVGALGHGASGSLEDAALELHALLVQRLRPRDRVDDALADAHLASGLRVPVQGHGEVAVGADVHRAVLLHEVLQVPLPPVEQLRGNFLDKLQQVLEGSGLSVNVRTPESEVVEVEGGVDAGDDVDGSRGGLAVPAAGSESVGRRRRHQRDRDAQPLEGAHEVAVAGGDSLDIGEGLLTPRSARVHEGKTMIELVLLLLILLVHAREVVPVGLRESQIHQAEVLVADGQRVPLRERNGSCGLSAFVPRLLEELCRQAAEVLGSVEAAVVAVRYDRPLRDADADVPLQALGPALAVELHLAGVAPRADNLLEHGPVRIGGHLDPALLDQGLQLCVVILGWIRPPLLEVRHLLHRVVPQHGSPRVCLLLVRKPGRAGRFPRHGEEAVHNAWVLRGDLPEEVGGHLACVHHHELTWHMSLLHEVRVDQRVKIATPITGDTTHRHEARPGLRIQLGDVALRIEAPIRQGVDHCRCRLPVQRCPRQAGAGRHRGPRVQAPQPGPGPVEPLPGGLWKASLVDALTCKADRHLVVPSTLRCGLRCNGSRQNTQPGEVPALRNCKWIWPCSLQLLLQLVEYFVHGGPLVLGAYLAGFHEERTEVSTYLQEARLIQQPEPTLLLLAAHDRTALLDKEGP
mmetsp:Transcript_61060/g.169293  ORF Transcript_61060/g.169293 Transcript_61060/m.169293 type:complete len:742 (-) Transcript_61060:58-2283(-)